MKTVLPPASCLLPSPDFSKFAFFVDVCKCQNGKNAAFDPVAFS